MKNLEMFNNFIGLGYKKGIRRDKLIDMPVRNFIILRTTWPGKTIYYLDSGNSLFIPWEWIDLFTSFYIHSGSEVLYFDQPEEAYEGYFECFIWLCTDLMKYFGPSKIEGDGFLDTLGNICNLGTEKFRERYKNLDLEPFVYKSKRKTFTI